MRSAEERAEIAFALMNALLSTPEAQSPLLWMLPAASLCDRSSSAAADFRTRVKERGDTVGITGLTGAPHPLLRSEELESELLWARSNAWSTGVDDTTPPLPWHLIATRPDTLRESAMNLYRSCEQPLWLLCGTAARRIITTPDGKHAVALATVTAEDVSDQRAEAEIKRAMRAATRGRSRNTPALLLIVAGTEATETVRWVAAAARGIRSSRRIDVLSHALSEPHETPPTDMHMCSESPGATPVRLQVLESLAELRRKRKSRIGTRRILEAAAGSPAHLPDANRMPRSASRSVIASMNGTAVIDGDGCFVMLDGGRFAGIWSEMAEAGKPSAARTIAYSPAGSRRKPVADVPGGCFSFESDQTRGAHSTLSVTVDDQQFYSTIDFTVAPDFPGLIISESTFIPERTQVTHCSQGLPIGDESPTIDARFADGSGYTIGPEAPEGSYPGEAFEITLARMRFTMLALSGSGAVMPWTVTVRRRPAPFLFLGRERRPTDPGVETFSLLVIPGGVDQEAVTTVRQGRLPRSLLKELTDSRLASAHALLERREV